MRSFIIFLLALLTILAGNSVIKSDVAKEIFSKDKNKEGEIIEIDRAKNRAKVKDLNMIKKHVKTTKEKKGGIFSKENFIHMSNLKIINEMKKTKKVEAKK